MTHNPAFSHRPKARTSICAIKDGDTIWVAAAFSRDGKRRDNYSRKAARQILLQRIEGARTGNQRVRYVFPITEVPENITARDVIAVMRQDFKPDPLENDRTFSKESEPKTYYPWVIKDADQRWPSIVDMIPSIPRLLKYVNRERNI